MINTDNSTKAIYGDQAEAAEQIEEACSSPHMEEWRKLNLAYPRVSGESPDWPLLYPNEMAYEALSIWGKAKYLFCDVRGNLTCVDKPLVRSPWPAPTSQEALPLHALPLHKEGLQTTIRRAVEVIFMRLVRSSSPNGIVTFLRNADDFVMLGFNAAIRVNNPDPYEDILAEVNCLADLEPIRCQCGSRACKADLTLDICRQNRLSRIERTSLIKYGPMGTAKYQFLQRYKQDTGYAASDSVFDEALADFSNLLESKGLDLSRVKHDKGRTIVK
jgi:hypothetical protein